MDQLPPPPPEEELFGTAAAPPPPPEHELFGEKQKPQRPVDQPSSDEAEPIPGAGGVAAAAGDALNLPGRGAQALSVLAERGVANAYHAVRGEPTQSLSDVATRGAEATKPDYVPRPGEKGGALLGRLIGDLPKYGALGAAVGPIAAAPVVAGGEALAKAAPAIAEGVAKVTPYLSTVSVGGGIGLVSGVLDDMAANGHITPQDVRNSMLFGAITAGGLHMTGDAGIELMMSDAGKSATGALKVFVDRARSELIALKKSYTDHMVGGPQNPELVVGDLPPGEVVGKHSTVKAASEKAYAPVDIQEEVLTGKMTPEQGAEEAGERFQHDLQTQGAQSLTDPEFRAKAMQPTIEAMVQSGIPRDQAVAQVSAAMHAAAVHAENVQQPQMTAPPEGSLPPAQAEDAAPAAPPAETQPHPIEQPLEHGKKPYEMTREEFVKQLQDETHGEMPLAMAEDLYEGVIEIAQERGLLKATPTSEESQGATASEVSAEPAAGIDRPQPAAPGPLSGPSADNVPSTQVGGGGFASSVHSVTGHWGEVKPPMTLDEVLDEPLADGGKRTTPEAVLADMEEQFQSHLEEEGGLNADAKELVERGGPWQANSMRNRLARAMDRYAILGKPQYDSAVKAVKWLDKYLAEGQQDWDAVHGAGEAGAQHPLRPYGETARGIIEQFKIKSKYAEDPNYSAAINRIWDGPHLNFVLSENGLSPSELAEMAHIRGDIAEADPHLLFERAEQQVADGDTKAKHDRVLSMEQSFAKAYEAGGGQPPEPPAPPAPPTPPAGDEPPGRPESKMPATGKTVKQVVAAETGTAKAAKGPVSEAVSAANAKSDFEIAEMKVVHELDLARKQAMIERLKTDAKVAAQMARNEKLQIRAAARAHEAELMAHFEDKLVKFMDGAAHDAAEAKVRAAWQDAIRAKIVEYARTYLPKTAQGRYLTTVRDAKTMLNLARAFNSIKELSVDLHKRALIEDIKKVYARALDSGGVDVGVKDMLKKELAGIALRGRSADTVERLSAIEQYVNHAKANGIEIKVPQALLDDIAQLSKRPIKGLTEAELEQMLANGHYLEDKGRFTKQLKDEIRQFRLDRRQAKLMAESVPIELHPQVLRKPGSNEMLGTKVKANNLLSKKLDTLQHMDIASTPMTPLFDMMGKRGGYQDAPYKEIYEPLVADWRRATILIDDAVNRARAEVARLGIDTPALERINMYLVDRQEGGRQHLLDSGISEAALNGLKLTPAEKELADHFMAEHDKPTAKMVQTRRDVYNEDTPLLKNHWPFQVKGEAYNLADEEGGDIDVNRALHEFLTKTLDQGFLQERKKGAGGAIEMNALTVFERYMRRVHLFNEMQANLKDNWEIVNSNHSRKALGKVGQNIIKNWLDLLARDGHGGQDSLRSLGWLRRNIAEAQLTFKISTALIHGTKVLGGGAEEGMAYLSRGMQAASFNKEAQALMNQNADLRMRTRTGPDPVYGETLKNIQSKALTYGLKAMLALDHWSASSVWAGAYMQNLEQRGLPVSWAKMDPIAEAVATRKMNLTQSSGLAHELPLALSRGYLSGSAEADKAWFQYQNPSLTKWSYIKHDAIAMGWRNGDPAEAARKLGWMAAAQLAHTGARWGSRAMLAAIMGGGGLAAMTMEDKAKEFAKDYMMDTLTMPPYVSNFVSMARYGQSPIAALQPGMDLGLVGRDVLFSQKQMSHARVIKDTALAINALASMAGIPGTGQVSQLVRDANGKEPLAVGGGYKGSSSGYRGGGKGYR